MQDGDPDSRYTLSCQLSGLQRDLEAKSGRLAHLQQQLLSGGAPPLPERGGAGRGGSQGEGHGASLEEAGWFHAGIPREIAMEILGQQSEGSFVVRESSSQPGYYALSLKTPDGRIVHYLIQPSPTGYCLQVSVWGRGEGCIQKLTAVVMGSMVITHYPSKGKVISHTEVM